MKLNQKNRIKKIIYTWLIMAIGLVLFKYIPMYINYLKFGTSDILYDASSHIVWTCFGLYFIWLFFIEKNKSLRTPYVILSLVVVFLMGIQRLYAHQHNTFGLMMGLLVAIGGMLVPRWMEVWK